MHCLGLRHGESKSDQAPLPANLIIPTAGGKVASLIANPTSQLPQDPLNTALSTPLDQCDQRIQQHTCKGKPAYPPTRANLRVS